MDCKTALRLFLALPCLTTAYSLVEHTGQKRSTDLMEGVAEGHGPVGDMPLRTDWWALESEYPSFFKELEPVPCCCGLMPASLRACNTACSARNSSSTLRYVGPGQGPGRGASALARALQGRRVVLIGVSVTRQWYESLMCWLGQTDWGFWPTLDSIPPDAAAYLTKLYESGGQHYKRWQPIDHLRLMGYSCQRIGDGVLTVYSQPVIHYPSHIEAVIRHHSTNADLIYLDPKMVHFQSATPQVVQFVDRVFAACKQWNAPCIVKDVSPQHFSIENYLWDESLRGTSAKCQGFVKHEMHESSWRHRFLVNASQYHGLPMLSLYEKLAPRGDMHSGDGDCTHFSFDQEIWEPLNLELLSQLERLPRRRRLRRLPSTELEHAEELACKAMMARPKATYCQHGSIP